MNNFYEIIHKLALCQIASDAGKRIEREELIALCDPQKVASALKSRYNYKDNCLKGLIGSLNRNYIDGVTYHINSNYHYLYDNMVIVYFNIKYKGRRYQVSFHSPFNKNFRKMADKSRASWICTTSSGKRKEEVMDSAETLVYLLTEIKKESE